MEVHAHTHTARKRWTHYFWEFFMLFLAVSLGFFVENQREHMIEHKREKQYMRSMIQDLRSDTMQLAKSIDLLQKREIMIDSLIPLLGSPDFKLHGNEIYYLARRISFAAYFFPNDRTILQLKNSGSLRLISNMNISDSIMLYDQEMRNLLYQFSDEFAIRRDYMQVARDKFNGHVYFSMFSYKNDSFTITAPSGNPQLFKQDAHSINEFVTQLQYLRNVTWNQRYREEDLKGKASNLIRLLKKEYNLN